MDEIFLGSSKKATRGPHTIVLHPSEQCFDDLYTLSLSVCLSLQTLGKQFGMGTELKYMFPLRKTVSQLNFRWKVRGALGPLLVVAAARMGND